MTQQINQYALSRLLSGWAQEEGALPERLASSLRRLITSGRLTAGVKLPSERLLAEALGVSRNVVSSAFETLRAYDVVTSRRGSGSFVTRSGQRSAARGDERFIDYTRPATPDEHLVDLRSAALPGLEMVLDVWSRLSTEELRPLISSHGYLPGGLPALRQRIAEYYSELGIPTGEDQVLVTSGAQQAIQLVANTILEPGATVLVEQPTFRGAINVLRSVGAQLIPAIDRRETLSADRLRADVVRNRPALMFVQSSIHNPTGSLMSEDEKRTLAGISDEFALPVIDDVAQLDATIDPPYRRPLAAYGGRTITVGSASKLFWGGLRVGWLRADADLVHRLVSVKAGEDLGTSLVAQVAVETLLARASEARECRIGYLRERRAHVEELVRNALPDWRFESPAGGASLWVRLPREGATAFSQRLGRRGVLLLAGPTFSASNTLDDHLRVAFSGPRGELELGIRRMAIEWGSVSS